MANLNYYQFSQVKYQNSKLMIRLSYYFKFHQDLNRTTCSHSHMDNYMQYSPAWLRESIEYLPPLEVNQPTECIVVGTHALGSYISIHTRDRQPEECARTPSSYLSLHTTHLSPEAYL